MALVACFLALALRHVHGQDATYDERFYFGAGRTILRQGTWDGVILLHPPLPYYVASLPLLGLTGEVSARDPRQLLHSRLATLLVFGVPLLLAVRAWARRLYGEDAGLLALALAAFWLTRVMAVNQVYYVALLFLSGQAAPLALLPSPVQLLATALPFRWLVAFPVELLLGRLTLQEAFLGLAMQGLWLAISLLVLRLVWRAGVRHYSAVGA